MKPPGDAPPAESAQTKREGRRGAVPTTPLSVPEPEAGRLARGTPVDRYIVLDVLGAGGMGVVYSAFDPELDRKVAIKLVQTEETGTPRLTEPLPGAPADDLQTWLVHEAQALARLSHPNVVAVHDVGTLPGGRVFIAMELVEGQMLRAWLAAGRSWRDVIPVMRAAGAGLAAAHAAGLVHRDFKPENVIVGKDGRVRVMDFGLARRRDAAAGAPPAKDLRGGPATQAGIIAGTPGYMAPETYAGHSADARTDQFAFGVALYEALFRERPFGPQDLSAPDIARPKPPSDARVPARIAAVALRAISIEPAERYPTMEDLLDELAVNSRFGRRRAALAVGSVLVAGIAVAAVLASRTHANELCTGFERRLAGVWDPAIAAEAKAAFLATKKPYAAQAFGGLERALDDYASRWNAASVDSCEATRVHGAQTEDVMMLRSECLDLRLEELRAFTRLVAGAQGNLVDKGDKAVFELEPIAKCANVAALREPGLPPEDKRPQIAALEKQIADAKAQLIAGRFLAALVATSKTVDGANATGWQPLVADALFTRGGTLLATGSFPEAAHAFTDSTWAAMRGRRDDLAARAALAAAMVTADGLGNPDKAKVWLEVGVASAARAGVDRAIELRRYEVEGLVLAEAGELAGGIAAHEKALASAELAYGKDSPAMWADEELVATTYTKADAFAKAIPHYERSLRFREASVGPDNFEVSVLLSNLGQCYRHVRDFKRARAALERALALREKLFGTINPILVAPLDNLGDLAASEGDLPAAIATYERGMKIAAAIPGTAHAMYHQIATDHAEALVSARRFAEARAAYAELLALEEANHSPVLATTQSSRAELALAEHGWDDAATWAERAVAGFEAKGGTETPALWLPLTRLGEAKLGRGDVDAAGKLFERALALGARFEVTPQDLARARDDYAKLRGR